MYLTIAEAAELARCKPKTLRNLMANGTLVEGIHYVRPRGRRPLFKRDALLAWLNGDDGTLVLATAGRTQNAKAVANGR